MADDFDFSPPSQWDRAVAVINDIYSTDCGGAVLNAARRGWVDTWENGGFGIAQRLPSLLVERRNQYGRPHVRLLESVRVVVNRIYAEQADSVNWWVE